MKKTGTLDCARLFASVLTSVFILSSCSGGAPVSSNHLNVGYGVTAPDSVDVATNFAGLMNYNGKTADELYAMRTRNAGLHPELLQGAYKPTPSVFQIESKTPWWGLKGYLFRAEDLNKTDGLSRESPFFGNPYLLVCPELYGTDLHRSPQRFSTAQSFADIFPAFEQPKSIKIFPKERREEITYDMMGYYNHVKALLDQPWQISGIGFDINAYNAEDFGYNYLYIEPGKSNNLNKLPPEVIKIGQTLMVRHRDTCGPACNDIDSPDTLKGFRLKSLPASCHLLLWREKPASHLDRPDFIVDMIFK